MYSLTSAFSLKDNMEKQIWADYVVSSDKIKGEIDRDDLIYNIASYSKLIGPAPYITEKGKIEVPEFLKNTSNSNKEDEELDFKIALALKSKFYCPIY